MTSSNCQLFVPAPMPAPFEGRAARRQRVILTGVLSDSRREASLACGVRNLSATGARLQLPGIDMIVSWRSLIVVRDACVYAIEPVWVSGDQAGVRLVGSRSFCGEMTHNLEKLRELWLEKLPRSGRAVH